MKVLIADDDADISNLIEIAVNKSGHEVVAAVRDGISAWEKLQDGGIDLVLVDVSMPGMTGLELTVQARSSAVLRGVKIVVITANAQSTIAAAAHAAGADAMITKPFTVRELVQSIRDLADQP